MSSSSSQPPPYEEALQRYRGTSSYGPDSYGASSDSRSGDSASSERFEGRDYTLILDLSDSMKREEDASITLEGLRKENMSRLDAAKVATRLFLEKCHQLDPDGVEVYTFNKKVKHYTEVTADNFENMGIFNKKNVRKGSRMTKALRQAIKSFFDKRKARGTHRETIFVITDGMPHSPNAVRGRIRNAMRRLEGPDDCKDLAISFIQIGRDEDAAAWLQEMDDGLGDPDIVDAKNFYDLANKSLTFDQVLLDAIID